MKKTTISVLIVLLSASLAPAYAASEESGQEEQAVLFNGYISPGYNWVSHSGNTRAGEYEYLRSSLGADVFTEYDPLPHRFSLDAHMLNEKDYFGEMSYAFRDVFVVNVLARSLYHNLDHIQPAPDLATASPSFVDRNPGDQYAIQNAINRAFVRFKLPDFPLHFFAEVTQVDRKGLVQQQFLREYAATSDRVVQSRNIDGSSREVRVGLNSHLGPVEAEYFHTEKRFAASGDKVLYETYPSFNVPHNEIPNLESSSDTVRIHTSYPGRVVAAATYAQGDKKNMDSSARIDYTSAAGDIVLTPVGGMVVVFKYRQYRIDADDPATVAVPALGTAYNIRTPISSKHDTFSGAVSYRVTGRVTVKGDYSVETVERAIGSGILSPLQTLPTPSNTGPNTWEVAHRTTKMTERLALYYRIMNRLTVRADVQAVQVDSPAYADDPDRLYAAAASATWTSRRGVTALVSVREKREKRSDLAAPLGGGSRTTDRNQVLGSITMPVGNRASVTASYLYFHTKTKETLSFSETAGTVTLDDGVPYGDRAQVASLAASVSPTDRVFLSADASRCAASGRFRLSGAVPNSSGIDSLSDMKIVEDILSASVEWNINKSMACTLRYQHRHYDDRIDDTQDGRVNSALATLQVKW